jgi:hypothetical protein
MDMTVWQSEKDKGLYKAVALAFLFSLFGLGWGVVLGAGIDQMTDIRPKSISVFMAVGWGAGGIIGAIIGLGSTLLAAIQERKP